MRARRKKTKEEKKTRKKTTHDVEVPLDPPELLPLLVEVVERGEGDLFRLLGGLLLVGCRRGRGKESKEIGGGGG